MKCHPHKCTKQHPEPSRKFLRVFFFVFNIKIILIVLVWWVKTYFYLKFGIFSLLFFWQCVVLYFSAQVRFLQMFTWTVSFSILHFHFHLQRRKGKSFGKLHTHFWLNFLLFSLVYCFFEHIEIQGYGIVDNQLNE